MIRQVTVGIPVFGSESHSSSNGPERGDHLGDVLSRHVRRLVHPLVADPAQPDEVVVLGGDLARRPGEVDLEHRHVAAQVADVEDQVVGQLGGVAPHDPADAERRQTELVARGADGLHPGQSEVPDDVGRAERRQERPTRAIDVQIDVQTRVGLEFVERSGDLGDRLVLARVGHPEGGHHEDGVLVDPLQHVVGGHAVVPVGHRHLSHLDVPVLRELVPDHLHRAADHVRSVGGLALGLTLRPPAPLRGHAGEHAGLGGPDRRGADRVLRVLRVPQVGQHVHAPPLELGGLWVLVLVDHVLVDAEVHQGVHLGSSQVWQNVARFCRELPSSISSSCTTW